MILGQDYLLRDDIYDPKKDETLPVELMVPNYEGVVYRYGKVNIVEEEEDDSARIQYLFDVIESGSHKTEDLEKDKVFMEITGLVLNSLILEVLNSDANGKNNNSEFNKE